MSGPDCCASPSGAGRWRATSVAALLGPAAFAISFQLKTGDLDPGAPELRPDSRYNRDVAYVNAHYGLSSDQFVVMVETPPEHCKHFATLFESRPAGRGRCGRWTGCKTTASPAEMVRFFTAGRFEGNPKWLAHSAQCVDAQHRRRPGHVDRPELADPRCAVTPLIAYLADHKADTLTPRGRRRRGLRREHGDPGASSSSSPPDRPASRRPPTSSCSEANRRMLVLLYAAVVVLCFITFRSWRAVDRGAGAAAHHLGRCARR